MQFKRSKKNDFYNICVKNQIFKSLIVLTVKNVSKNTKFESKIKLI